MSVESKEISKSASLVEIPSKEFDKADGVSEFLIKDEYGENMGNAEIMFGSNNEAYLLDIHIDDFHSGYGVIVYKILIDYYKKIGIRFTSSPTIINPRVYSIWDRLVEEGFAVKVDEPGLIEYKSI